MRVSSIFSQGGGYGRGDDYGRGCGSGCGDHAEYYGYRDYNYYNGYNERGCRDRDYERSGRESGGLLSGLFG